MKISGTIEGKEELTKKILDLQQGLLDEIINSLDDIGNVGKASMQAEAPVATSHLRESVTIDIDKGNNEARLTIFPSAEYAIYVEKGRGAGGLPPIENIRTWAKAKGFPETHLFVLQKAIAAGSTKANQPNAFVERAFEKVVDVSDKTVSEAVKKIVKRIFG